MKIKFRISLLLLTSILWSFSFQSCDTSSISDAIDTATTDTTTDGDTKMTPEEQSAQTTKYLEDITFISDKKHEIKNEHVHHSDRFNFKCGSDSISLERTYNDQKEIHILSYQVIGDDGSRSNKQHFFWENKLIYQFHHHETANGDDLVMDDHQTYFKDGEMFQCLEKKISYKKGVDSPSNLLSEAPYEHVNCVSADKSTKDIEKLLSLTEEEAKEYFCK